MQNIIKRIDKRRMEGEIVSAVTMEDDFTLDTLKNEKAIKTLMVDLKTYLKTLKPDMQPLDFSIGRDTEHDCYTLQCSSRKNGSIVETTVDWEFVHSPEFIELKALAKELKNIGSPPFIVEGENDSITVNTFQEVIDHVSSIGKKGLYIQRYKGLGEMNPEQLWETTMNPESRVLKQVKIEDIVETDEIFTILMGDQVEPRRNFIEKHALDVVNLDI